MSRCQTIRRCQTGFVTGGRNDGPDLAFELVVDLAMLTVFFVVMGALDWLGALD